MSDIIKDTVERLLDRINGISQDGPGFTRPSYSPLESQAHRVIEDEAIARHVHFELGPQSRSQPTKLSAALGAHICEAARALGHVPRRMLSGGGHDAAAFAQAGWESVMVFLRNWNGSHNPEEAMDPADLVVAVKALHLAVGDMGGMSKR